MCKDLKQPDLHKDKTKNYHPKNQTQKIIQVETNLHRWRWHKAAQKAGK